MRLIDADALAERLWAECREWEGESAYQAGLCAAAVIVAEAPTVGGWISVDDRLPEVGRVVLAFGTRSATTGMFQGVSVRNDCWWWKGHTIKHVFYWMPLPELPKEG